jgi:hypothetical protein
VIALEIRDVENRKNMPNEIPSEARAVENQVMKKIMQAKRGGKKKNKVNREKEQGEKDGPDASGPIPMVKNPYYKEVKQRSLKEDLKKLSRSNEGNEKNSFYYIITFIGY